MSDPITAMAVGAAIGGGTSLARGQSFGNSLKSAAIGGALGGGGSYLGGLMSGAGAGATSGGSSLLGSGVATTPVSFSTGGYASGIGGQVIPNVAPNIVPAITTAGQTATQNFIPQHLVGNSTGIPNYKAGDLFYPQGVSNFVENTPFMPNANVANTIKNAPSFALDKSMLGKSAGYTGGGQGSGFFSNFGGNALDSMKTNPLTTLSAAKTVNDVINPVKPAEPAVIIPPILKGTAPKILPNAEAATGQTGLESKLAMLNPKRRNLYDIPIDYSIG